MSLMSLRLSKVDKIKIKRLQNVTHSAGAAPSFHLPHSTATATGTAKVTVPMTVIDISQTTHYSLWLRPRPVCQRVCVRLILTESSAHAENFLPMFLWHTFSTGFFFLMILGGERLLQSDITFESEKHHFMCGFFHRAFMSSQGKSRKPKIDASRLSVKMHSCVTATSGAPCVSPLTQLLVVPLPNNAHISCLCEVCNAIL